MTTAAPITQTGRVSAGAFQRGDQQTEMDLHARDTEQTARQIRTALERKRNGVHNIGTPEELHAFVDRFIGPCVATRETRLRPKKTLATPA